MSRLYFALFLAACSGSKDAAKGDYNFGETGETGNDKIDTGFDEGLYSACQAIVAWSRDCELPQDSIDEQVAACEEVMDTIEEECVDRLDIYENAYSDFYGCLSESGYCPDENDSDRFTNCREEFVNAAGEIEEDCLNSGENTIDQPEGDPVCLPPEPIEFQAPPDGLTPLQIGDDDFIEIPLDFPIRIGEQSIQSLTVASNGLVHLGSSENDGCCFGETIPNEKSPNGIIAVAWMDLMPNIGGSVSWGVVGEDPERRVIISWQEVPVCCDGDSTISAWTQIHEIDALIEIHAKSVASDSPTTIGFENHDGTLAYCEEDLVAQPIEVSQQAWSFYPVEVEE